MRLLIALIAFTTFSVFAQTDAQMGQLTQPDEGSGVYRDIVTYSGSRYLKINPEMCKKIQDMRAKLKELSAGSEEYSTLLKEILSLSDTCSQNTVLEGDEVVGFHFTNDTKNKINPQTAPNESSREFKFTFEQRSLQNAHLAITENSGLTGLMSHDLLETTVVFIPRKTLPYIDVASSTNCTRTVVLPTEELIVFDLITKEIISGALKESPMDMTESRHQRKFAGLEYTGNGIMIRVDRRAGTPEHNYNVSYNVNERIKQATLTHKGKTCYVPKEVIFANANNADLGAYIKYETDQELLDAINPICKWNLALSDIQ